MCVLTLLHAAETVELSRKFHVVFNAFNYHYDDISAWRAAVLTFTCFAACQQLLSQEPSACWSVAIDNRTPSALDSRFSLVCSGESFRVLREGLSRNTVDFRAMAYSGDACFLRR